MEFNNIKRFLIFFLAFLGLFFALPSKSLAACPPPPAGDPPYIGIWSLTCPPATPLPNTCIPDSGGITATSVGGTNYIGCCCPPDDFVYGDARGTALGVLSTNPGYLVKDLLTLALSIIGGITLLLFLFGTIRYITSNGNPEAVAQAKGIITAAITGTAVIVLAVLLLGLLGVNVIGIPGWRFNGTQLETPN